MEDKSFDLLEKMYIEFSNRFNNLEGDMKSLKSEVKENSNHIIRLENEFHSKIGALADETKVIRSDVSFIKDKLDVLENKVEKHDIKIQVIEGGKKKSKFV